MEAARSLLSPPPSSISRTHLRNPLSSSSVMMLHGQASRAIISTTSAAWCFSTFLLTQEQHSNCNNFSATRAEKVAQAMADLQNVEDCSLSSEEREKYHFGLYLKNMERGLLYHPGSWYSFLGTHNLEKLSIMRAAQSINEKHAGVNTDLMQIKQNKVSTMSPEDVLALAKRALMASQDAALLMEKSRTVHMLVKKNREPSLDPSGSTYESSIEGKTTLRSIRLSKRQSKQRKVFTKSSDVPPGTSTCMHTDKVKRTEKKSDNNDPLRMFLWGPETKQLLTITEEKDLFVQIQDLMGLETVKEKLTIQFDREPTLIEWAQATGMSCRELQACISSGIRGRNRVIYANFRLVIHVAKQYEGKGLNIQDLLQEGSIGLMKSLEKFKPKLGCRFSTYAYWWIRQSIVKSIFQNSRTIRLPENVFGELKKIRTAKRMCLQEGRAPTNEDLAKQAGMHVSKLENLLRISKNPISIQGHTWIDQDITFQEVTADPKIETPELAVEKQMMRQHAHSLLGALSPRERKLIRLRFGIRHSEPKSLQQIGDLLGISKERVRQLESRALNKMKACCSTQELGSYSHFLL